MLDLDDRAPHQYERNKRYGSFVLTSLKEYFTIKSASYTYIFGLAMKFMAFIVLVSHLNFSMFIAQIDEVDVFDKSGQQREDINSLVEYLATTFHIKHKPIKDSDDDNARYFHVVKLPNCIVPLPIVTKEDNFNFDNKIFPLYIEKKLISLSLDIQGPPPKI